MVILNIRQQINSIILFFILVSNTMYHSELGGAESVYNRLSFFLVVLLIFANGNFNRSLLLTFSVPLVFLFLSVIINSDSLEAGGYRSALATTVGYLLLAQDPIQLNKKLLRRLVNQYLALCIAISIYVAWISDDVLRASGNSNFNVNPNSASLFFFACLILTLVFSESRIRLFFSVGFTFLTLTTGSRAGFVSIILLWASWLLFRESHNVFLRSVFSKSSAFFVSVLASLFLAVTFIFPGSIEYLLARLEDQGLDFSSTRGMGRSEIWQDALELSGRSMSSLLFGNGPASTGELMSIGTHGSYAEAITSVGWPFLIFTLVALIMLFRYHLKLGQKEFLIYGMVILIYGLVETILFNGISSLWFIFMMVSLYYRSRAPDLCTQVALSTQGKYAHSHR